MTGERRLTFIIVPHGDLDTRSYEISYRRLKLLLGAAAGVVVLFAIMISTWFYVAAQAARVIGLEREVERLQAERAQVARLARTLADVEAQYEKVRKLLGADAAPRGSEPVLPPLQRSEESDVTVEEPAAASASAQDAAAFAWPLAEAGYVTRNLSGDGDARHPGIDIAVPQHSYVRATSAGTVRQAAEDPVYGRYIWLDHPDGTQSLYAHAAELFVQRGDRVDRGEVIALSGSTGRSSAPHLHFEIRRNGAPVDPLRLVRQP